MSVLLQPVKCLDVRVTRKGAHTQHNRAAFVATHGLGTLSAPTTSTVSFDPAVATMKGGTGGLRCAALVR